MESLRNFPNSGIDSAGASDQFCMTIEMMGNIFRRFIDARHSWPDLIFQLDGLPFGEFIDLYEKQQKVIYDCEQCMDRVFALEILLFMILDNARARVTENTRLKVKQMQDFLHDVMVYAPVSSDRVECWHGAIQHVLHRSRSVRPSMVNSAAMSVLYSVACWFQHVLRHVRSKFIPATSKKIIAGSKRCSASANPAAHGPMKKLRGMSGYSAEASLYTLYVV